MHLHMSINYNETPLLLNEKFENFNIYENYNKNSKMLLSACQNIDQLDESNWNIESNYIEGFDYESPDLFNNDRQQWNVKPISSSILVESLI